jgi:Flp pilus assembly protein TadD
LRSDILLTIDLFEQATRKDPEFACAWSGLAAVYAVAPSWNYRDKDYASMSQEAANTAIQLDPKLALPYAVLSGVMNQGYTTFAGYEHALKLLNKSLELDPSELSALQWRGNLYAQLGYFEQAKSDYLTCLVVDPSIEICRRFLALVTLYQGKIAEALHLFEKGVLKGFRGGSFPFIFAYAAQENQALVLGQVFNRNMRREPATPKLIEIEYRAVTEKNFNFAKERTAIESIALSAYGEAVVWDNSSYSFLFRYYEKVNNSRYLPFKWFLYPQQWRGSPHRKRLMIQDELPQYWRKYGFPSQCQALPNDDFICK